MRIRGIFRLAAWMVALGSSISAWAQGTSSLRGAVTDQQKAVIAAAQVTLTDQDTGVVRTMVTQDTGQYQFLQLRPGSYSLAVEAPGFSVTRAGKIQLLVDTPATVDVSLQVAASATSVNVVADSAQLNTVDASVGNAFQEAQISALPIQTPQRGGALLESPAWGHPKRRGYVERGAIKNNITLDGVDVNDNQNALSGLNGNSSGNGFNAALPVPLDSVQEFRVTVAGNGASEGHTSSGGQVSLVTRGGTNVFHVCSAYEYNRNTDYTANNWFNNRSGLARPQLIRNQFGASLGAPTAKRTGCSFSEIYERRLDHSQATCRAGRFHRMSPSSRNLEISGLQWDNSLRL